MSFADNLKQLRRDKHLSQEELAELLHVSRQAVSKWEQGIGYPEVENLLLLSRELNISLDQLLSTGFTPEAENGRASAGTAVCITSPHENVIANCYRFLSSQKFLGGKGSPHYALFGVSTGPSSFWGEASVFLGWYADKEQITKEILEIQNAIAHGLKTYTLKYSVSTERRWGRIKIITE